MAELQEASQATRKSARSGIVITHDDVTILQLLFQYRLLHIEQLCALTISPTTKQNRTYTRIHKRLKGMLDSEPPYVGRIERPQRKDIYYIKRRGLAVLLQHGVISDEDAERRVREGELKSSEFLEHELMISDIHLLCSLVHAKGVVDHAAWKQGREIEDSFEVFEHGEQKEVDIKPDAFFTLREVNAPEGQRKTRSFLLEADRSTMSKKARPGSRRMDDKTHKYELFMVHDRPRVHPNVKLPHVYVLTITVTRARRDSLAASAGKILMDADRRKYFLFASLEDLPLADPASMLAPVFMRAGDTEAARFLLPWLQKHP